MAQMQAREVIVIELDLPGDTATLMLKTVEKLSEVRIQNVVLRFDSRRIVDIGSWCYKKRSSGRNPKKVCPDSYDEVRAQRLREFAVELITYGFTGSLSSASAKLADFSVLLNWSEGNNHEDFLIAPENYHKTLKSFTAHLLTGERGKSTPAQLQRSLLTIANWLYPDTTIVFSSGMPHISVEHRKGEEKSAPSSGEMSSFLTVLYALFSQLTDFLLTNVTFPHKITLGHLTATVTTHSCAYLSDKILKTKLPLGKYSPLANFHDGLWRAREDAPQYSGTIGDYNKRIKKFKAQLNASNTNMRDLNRMRLAKIAHDAFLGIFTAASGLNEAPIINLQWTGHFETLKGQKGMRTLTVVKYRGGPHLSSFTVHSSFLPVFNQYLNLRNFILEDSEHPYLFIGLPASGQGSIGKLARTTLINLCRNLRITTDPDFPTLSYRDLRRYKDYFIVTNSGIKIAALLLQHSGPVQRQNYTNINEREAVDQIATTLRAFAKTFSAGRTKSIPGGGCAGNKPTADSEPPPGYTPDCKSQVGCIFCTHFRTTAEAENIRKLASMKYIIKQRIHSCDNLEHFQRNHQPALDQIQLIFTEIENHSENAAALLKKIHTEVFDNGELTDYWLNYLKNLVHGGVIK